MGVTFMLAMAVLAIGFILSIVALGLALAIVVIIIFLAAMALGFLCTLIPPLIPILPIILPTVIAMLIYAMARIIGGLTEAATLVAAITPGKALSRQDSGH
jgi:energy-coupling factor transporter transmembrane protein EcfT